MRFILRPLLDICQLNLVFQKETVNNLVKLLQTDRFRFVIECLGQFQISLNIVSIEVIFSLVLSTLHCGLSEGVLLQI